MVDCCCIVDNEIHLAIKAVPGASKNDFAGVKDGRLRVRIAAAPEGGKANSELIAFIAKALGCPKRDVILLHGEKSRHKTLALPLAYKERLAEMFERTNSKMSL